MPTSLSAGALLATSRRAAACDPGTADSALTATLFAALSVEAWINELLFYVQNYEHEDEPRIELLRKLVRAARLNERSATWTVKLDVIGTALAGVGWTRGVQPYQDLDLLVDIRNTLVHLRPETTPIEVLKASDGTLYSEQNELAPVARRLVERGVVQRTGGPDTITPVMAVLQMPQVGRWAHQVATCSISAIADLVPPTAMKRDLLFGIREFLPSR